MLFDLRSRGRKRVIRVIYLFLALLLGGGLVFFGIGGGAGSTGLLSGLAQNGTGSASGFKVLENAVTKTRRAAKAAPNSAPAWDAYARAVFQLAYTNYVPATATTAAGFTTAGAQELAVLTPIWKHYLALAPAKPDAALASEIASAYGQQGIQVYPVAETAQEIVAASDATSYDQWAELAVYAYLAHEPGPAAIAQAKALKLAPKADRAQLNSEIDQVATQSGGATSAAGAT
jgi:hypothetical protein